MLHLACPQGQNLLISYAAPPLGKATVVYVWAAPRWGRDVLIFDHL